MTKLIARDRLRFVRELSGKRYSGPEAKIWDEVRAWTPAQIDVILGSSMTESGVKAKCIAEAKRRLSMRFIL